MKFLDNQGGSIVIYAKQAAFCSRVICCWEGAEGAAAIPHPENYLDTKGPYLGRFFPTARKGVIRELWRLCILVSLIHGVCALVLHLLNQSRGVQETSEDIISIQD